MKHKKKIISFSSALVIFILIGLFHQNNIILNNNGKSVKFNDDEIINDKVKVNLRAPKTSEIWNNFSYIHIDGNWSTAAAYEWCRGDGSWGNPYVIENMTITAVGSPTGSGIFINNSKNDYFIIRNVTVLNAGSGSNDAGIKMENTKTIL